MSNFNDKLQELFVSIENGLGSAGIYILAIVLLVVSLIVFVVLAFSSDEYKTNQSINMLNSYLARKQYIDSENLVEFNRLMKKIPRPMREQWQRYMINRNDKPSKFINHKNCVEDVVKGGLFSNIVNSYYKLFTLLFATVLLLISVARASQTDNVIGEILWLAIGPVSIFLTLSFIAHIFMKIIYNNVITDMRYNIAYLESSLDRAVSRMPEVVDYEILFTKKEIRSNIPALQEYYIQKAQYEEEELRQAKNREVEHEDYNFEELGIDGSIVMERAMKECEYYLGNRRRLMQEIDQISSEKASVEKEFNDKYRSAQRKITEIKENLNRLKERLANTTQKIVSNDIRKQQADEIKKQQVIEKEIEEDEAKFRKEIERIDKEIVRRKEEIEEGRKYVEKALIQEFNEFSAKTKNILRENVIKTVEAEMNDMVKDIENLKLEIANKEAIIQEDIQITNDKVAIIEDLSNQLDQKENELQKIIDNANVIEKEVYRYFDAAGQEFFMDGERLYYLDENGNKRFYDEENEEVNADEDEGGSFGGGAENDAPFCKQEIEIEQKQEIKKVVEEVKPIQKETLKVEEIKPREEIKPVYKEVVIPNIRERLQEQEKVNNNELNKVEEIIVEDTNVNEIELVENIVEETNLNLNNEDVVIEETNEEVVETNIFEETIENVVIENNNDIIQEVNGIQQVEETIEEEKVETIEENISEDNFVDKIQSSNIIEEVNNEVLDEVVLENNDIQETNEEILEENNEIIEEVVETNILEETIENVVIENNNDTIEEVNLNNENQEVVEEDLFIEGFNSAINEEEKQIEVVETNDEDIVLEENNETNENSNEEENVIVDEIGVVEEILPMMVETTFENIEENIVNEEEFKDLNQTINEIVEENEIISNVNEEIENNEELAFNPNQNVEVQIIDNIEDYGIIDESEFYNGEDIVNEEDIKIEEDNNINEFKQTTQTETLEENQEFEEEYYEEEEDEDSYNMFEEDEEIIETLNINEVNSAKIIDEESLNEEIVDLSNETLSNEDFNDLEFISQDEINNFIQEEDFVLEENNEINEEDIDYFDEEDDK